MKLIDSIMNKLGFVKKQNKTYANFLDGSGYVYSQFGKNIYASDCVQVAIQSIANEMKKLNPIHYKKVNGEEQLVEGQIQKVLENPNPLMTTCDYIEKIVWNLFFNYNAFVFPVWNGDKLESLHPLQPTNVEFYQDTSGKLFIAFQFANGYASDLIPYENIIHIRYKYSVNDAMGGNEYGQPDHDPLLKTLQLNEDLISGLAKSLKMQTTLQAVINLKTYVDNDKQIQAIKDFESMVKKQETAMLPIIATDLGSNITPINKQIQLLDQTTLDFVDKKIFRWFGTSQAIVNGDYNTDQFNAFFQKTLEPLIIAFEQAHTKGLFTGKQAYGYGNKIRFELDALVHMTTSEKLTFATQLIDSGSCYKNELRRIGGLRPLKIFEGQLANSSNLQNALNNTNNGGGADE